MKQQIKKYLHLISISVIAILLTFSSTLTLIHAAVVNPNVNANAAIVVDAKTGQILAGQNINTPLAAASTSKLLTAYLVNQAVADGKFKWDTPIKISTNVAKVSTEAELTNVPLVAGKSYPVKKLYEAALLGSANAAAMALGEAVSGSAPKFIDTMKRQLSIWGIKDATINNAAGLLNSQAGSDAVGSNPHTENLWSAKTMAIIARHLVNDYPAVLQTTSLLTTDFEGQKVATTDMLLPGGRVKTAYHFDGLKTGTSVKAHQNFVGTLTYHGRRLITVIDGTGPVNGEDPTRFIETIKLLDTTLQQMHFVKIKAHSLDIKTKVSHAKKTEVKVTNAQTISLWVPNAEKITYFKVTPNVKIKAPLAKGSQVGLIRPQDATYLNEFDTRVADAVTIHKVQPEGFFTTIFNTIMSWF